LISFYPGEIQTRKREEKISFLLPCLLYFLCKQLPLADIARGMCQLGQAAYLGLTVNIENHRWFVTLPSTPCGVRHLDSLVLPPAVFAADVFCADSGLDKSGQGVYHHLAKCISLFLFHRFRIVVGLSDIVHQKVHNCRWRDDGVFVPSLQNFAKFCRWKLRAASCKSLLFCKGFQHDSLLLSCPCPNFSKNDYRLLL